MTTTITIYHQRSTNREALVYFGVYFWGVLLGVLLRVLLGVSINSNKDRQRSPNINKYRQQIKKENKDQQISTNINKDQQLPINVNSDQRISTNINQKLQISPKTHKCQQRSTISTLSNSYQINITKIIRHLQIEQTSAKTNKDQQHRWANITKQFTGN